MGTVDNENKLANIGAATNSFLEQLIVQQREKVLKLARRLQPRLADEDILNPHDLPALRESAEFNFEDGILCGYLAAQTALRVWLREQLAGHGEEGR